MILKSIFLDLKIYELQIFYFKIFMLQIFLKISELQIYPRFCPSFTAGRFIQYLFRFTIEELSNFEIFKILPKILKISEHFQDFLVEDSLKIFQDFTKIFKIPDYFEDLTADKMVLQGFKIFEFYYSLSLFIYEFCTYILYF